MYMSGLEVPGLGSVKDRVLRRFMDHEVRRRLKSEQITWTIAYLAAGEENKDTLKKLWSELVDLEFGGEVPVKPVLDEDSDEVRWLKEYEAMKTRDVRLVRKDGKLSVQGL